MTIIPFNPSISSRQTLNVNLGELVCNFRIAWNERVRAWFADFETTTGKNLSMELVTRTPILGAPNKTGLPGDFRVLKFNRMGESVVNYDNFGSDWRLVYGTDEEWEEYDASVQP